MNSWVEGKLIKKEDGYYIDNELILYNWEDGVLQKGVEWLCKKFKFKSVLELGFGLGWTATEFQKHGIKRHVILEPNKEVYKNALKWNKNYNAEIINVFSWEYESKEDFDLIYDDIVFLNNAKNHNNWLKKFKNQLLARNAGPAGGISEGDFFDFRINNIKYRQNITWLHKY